EINSTFYRAPSPGMVLGWARYTPEDFVFAAKVPQTVTHDRLLDLGKGADTDLLAYCELMRPLLDAGKLGPLLLQLPPRLRLQQVGSQAETVYGFFNNHFHGYAPENCIQILRMLGVQTQEQARALQRIDAFRKQTTAAEVRLRSLTLEDFGADTPKDALVEVALARFMDRN